MSAEKLAKRYAKALFDDAQAKGILEAVNTDMLLVSKTIQDSRELNVFFKNPIIRSAKKIAVLKRIFGEKISADSFSLILLLIDKGREGYMKEVASFFNKTYNDFHHILEVTITTAVPLDNVTEASIKKAIYSKVGEKNLIVKSVVDTKILGGFIVDLGNKVYDASVRNKLSNISNQLIYN
ncbi:MAG TPA: ATP synthase F1 subunit delta [Chitinophagales bacterium]|nr:ATP synthase F1 subunit delta [Chitinophagales bacterium]